MLVVIVVAPVTSPYRAARGSETLLLFLARAATFDEAQAGDTAPCGIVFLGRGAAPSTLDAFR